MANDRNRSRKRRKVCNFCVDKIDYIDYKDSAKLRPYHRHLCPASAPADRGYQAGSSRGSAALHR